MLKNRFLAVFFGPVCSIGLLGQPKTGCGCLSVKKRQKTGPDWTLKHYILGTFLYNNYKQALSLLETKPAVTAALTKVGASNAEVVKEWLQEEETYLCGLSKEPLEETLEMEYYKMLKSLRVTEWVTGSCLSFKILVLSWRNALAIANTVWSNLTPATIGWCDTTQAIETARCHAIELHEKDLHAVQLMEKRLNISDC